MLNLSSGLLGVTAKLDHMCENAAQLDTFQWTSSKKDGRKQEAIVTEADASHVQTMTHLALEMGRYHEDLHPLHELSVDAENNYHEINESSIKSNEDCAFVASVGGDAVGLITVRIKHASPVFARPKYGLIDTLIVLPALRQQGIAAKIMDAAFAWLKQHDVEDVELLVAAGNELGSTFWRKQGFGDFIHRLHRKL